MSRTIVDVYALQTVPPSNLNRDDQGSPKTSYYGGVQRARVSSQAWKRCIRKDFRETATEALLGVRTKRIVELLAERIVAASDGAIDVTDAQKLAGEIYGAVGIKLAKPRTKQGDEPAPDEAGYLVFLSNRQFDRLAEFAVSAVASGDASAAIKAGKRELREILKQDASIDVSLFGRMIADDTDLNVDAAAQVAHAISVHRVQSEADYFTAVDDVKERGDDEDSGAAMIGIVEFNSSTLYRYATIDVDALQANLGNAESTRIAVEAFVRGFATTVPSGKQNTFAHRTLPDLLVVAVRDTQPVNLVGAFERAVTGDYVRAATEALVARAKDIDENYGTAPMQSWVVAVGDETAGATALGDKVPLAELVSGLSSLVSARLGA